MELDLQVIRQQVVHATKALLEQANLKAGDIFVLGCSSSEICGGHIGKASSEEVGQVVIDAILPVLRERGIFLAVQGCEHINRSLVVEREAAERYDLEIVTVKPALHAGGACAVAAYDRAEDPVMVEHITAKAGMDIGDTFIGQHIKHVQIPVRLDIDQIGAAHATFVRSRPKLIGGPTDLQKLEQRGKTGCYILHLQDRQPSGQGFISCWTSFPKDGKEKHFLH